MNARHLRLRTIMLMIAALAVVMGVIRVLTQLVGVSGISLGLEGSKVSFAIAVLPGTAVDINATGPSMRIMFIHDIYALVPLWIIIAAATVVIAPLALVIYRRAAQAGPNQTRGAADPPKPAASNASRQCPTIKNGS